MHWDFCRLQMFWLSPLFHGCRCWLYVKRSARTLKPGFREVEIDAFRAIWPRKEPFLHVMMNRAIPEVKHQTRFNPIAADLRLLNERVGSHVFVRCNVECLYGSYSATSWNAGLSTFRRLAKAWERAWTIRRTRACHLTQQSTTRQQEQNDDGSNTNRTPTPMTRQRRHQWEWEGHNGGRETTADNNGP